MQYTHRHTEYQNDWFNVYLEGGRLNIVYITLYQFCFVNFFNNGRYILEEMVIGC